MNAHTKESNSANWESYGYSYVYSTSGAPYKSERAAKRNPRFLDKTATLLKKDEGFIIRTGIPMTPRQAKEYLENFSKHPRRQYPRSNMPVNEKPLSVDRPDLFEKSDQAKTVLGLQFWQMDYEKVVRYPRWRGMSKSYWNKKREQNGLPSVP